MTNAKVVHSLILEKHSHEDMYAKVNQIMGFNNYIRGIDKTPCCTPAEPFEICRFNYERIMVSIYFLTDANKNAATYAGAIHNVDGRRFLKNGQGRLFMIGAINVISKNH